MNDYTCHSEEKGPSEAFPSWQVQSNLFQSGLPESGAAGALTSPASAKRGQECSFRQMVFSKKLD